ncbi:acetylxylan esterase [Mucilaginibacter robiniae]|uniref:Acetylxylan esterase n=1 Tax=Mucilaginibacter robiniae TaxID=2728022 RepID=A0A7L5DVE3_9SPHI|nr:acetylxylan esterase [Mucilaginibacter robiniae]QJD95042.1 acetylxylan esterase [Mucilaginibacter robiniae]
MLKIKTILINLFLVSSIGLAYAQDSSDEEMFITPKPGHKNAVFDDNSSITYKLAVKSTYKTRQDGALTTELLTDDWKKVWTSTTNISLSKKGSHTYSVHIPHQSAGIYRVNFRLNLTDYDDTIRRVVAISPEKITTELHKPTDFNQFWSKSKEQLAKINPDYHVTEDTQQSTRDVKVYKVEMRSWNNVKIRGWLTVPTQGKNWPVIYKLPGYNVAMKPEIDKPDFAVFALDVRGNGMSRDMVAPATDRYNVTGIESRESYIYHGVYMDCLRGLDFILSHADLNLNTSRVCAYGGSQGATLAIIVAALDKRVTACTVELPLYADIHDAYAIGTSFPTTTWPMNHFQDYLKQHRGFTPKRFFDIWDYYDPQNFISQVNCPILMGVGLLDEFCPPRCSFGMYNKIAKNVQKEYRVAPDKAHEMNFDYFMFQLLWFKESLRAPN